MRATVQLEWIGYGSRDTRYRPAWDRDLRKPIVWQLMSDGICDFFCPIDGQLDRGDANSCASRGVYLYYHLDDGIYKIQYYKSWKRKEIYWIKVANGDIVMRCSTYNDIGVTNAQT